MRADTVVVGAGAAGAVIAARMSECSSSGTEELIVADASLLPKVPSCNTNVPTRMLGERFAAWLRDGKL